MNFDLAYFDVFLNIEILHLDNLNEFENEINKQLEIVFCPSSICVPDLKKIQKYYFFSIKLRECPECCGKTRLGIGALEVPLSVKMTKMPLVNPKFDQRSNEVKTLT